MTTAITMGTLAGSVVNRASWKDYPSSQAAADELEKLLSYLDRSSARTRFEPRLLARPQQRDEALNEIRAAFHLDSLGYPVVDWNEPQDASGYNVEFAVALDPKARALVEVKSPGWESELPDTERIGGRTKQPKYIDGEGRAADPVGVIRRAVEKARPKFSGTVPSLVVISDDCFVNLGEWGYGPEHVALTGSTIAYGDGLFRRPEFALIGAVCLFRTLSYVGQPLSYQTLCVANPNALHGAVIPAEMVSRLSATVIDPNT